MIGVTKRSKYSKHSKHKPLILALPKTRTETQETSSSSTNDKFDGDNPILANPWFISPKEWWREDPAERLAGLIPLTGLNPSEQAVYELMLRGERRTAAYVARLRALPVDVTDTSCGFCAASASVFEQFREVKYLKNRILKLLQSVGRGA